MAFDPVALQTGLNGATPENQKAVERLYRRVIGKSPGQKSIVQMVEEIEDRLIVFIAAHKRASQQ